MCKYSSLKATPHRNCIIQVLCFKRSPQQPLKCASTLLLNQWWSLETWSRSRDQFFQVLVSVSKVSGLVSVSSRSRLALVSVSSRSRRGLVSVSVSKDFGLGLELLVQRLCMSYFFWCPKRRSSLKNGFTKQLFKSQPFKEASG